MPMFDFYNDDQQIDKKIENQEKKIKELIIRSETLEREFNQFLAEMKVTREQIRTFIETKDFFTEEDWEEIQKQQKALEQKLLVELKNIANPNKTKASLAEQKDVKPQWLYVK